MKTGEAIQSNDEQIEYDRENHSAIVFLAKNFDLGKLNLCTVRIRALNIQFFASGCQ